jgi:hypothetical protein
MGEAITEVTMGAIMAGTIITIMVDTITMGNIMAIITITTMEIGMEEIGVGLIMEDGVDLTVIQAIITLPVRPPHLSLFPLQQNM